MLLLLELLPRATPAATPCPAVRESTPHLDAGPRLGADALGPAAQFLRGEERG